jgi:predicted phage terminase large subunit-like protein
MEINQIKKYRDFFVKTKDEPLVIIQGSKRSGKTFSILQNIGIDFLSSSNKKYQCFSESPKQQNFGLMSDYQHIFNPILHKIKTNSTQKTFLYKGNQLAFINIADNTNANDIANSLGACDIRYINECNTFSKDTVEKLRINNRGQMFLDFNPYRKFWVDELVTDTNFLKTTWQDNPFLTKNQVDLFIDWTKKGKASEVGSYNYWRWQVMCEGNYAEITGEIFTTENIHFASGPCEGLHNYIIFADPSNAKGGDNFALTLTATDRSGHLYLIDSLSRNKIEKVLMAEKIKEWQRDYAISRTLIETNGQIGLKFYNDCIASQIAVEGWYSRQDKYERIMSNFDVITQKLIILDTPQNRDFARQIYTFKIDCEHDDNIDCLNNAIMAYIMLYGELKIIFA